MPAFYFPLQKGLYEVKPGLFPLGRDFGNGRADQQFFQIDSQFEQYRQVKLHCRNENLDKYFQLHQLPDATLGAVMQFIISRLCNDYPAIFSQHPHQHGLSFRCQHSKDQLEFNANFTQLITSDGISAQHPLDAISLQLQEDISILQLDSHHDDYLAAIHLCFANHWAAQEKIGLPFTSIHQPVAGITNINLRHREIIQAMIQKGPFVRFAWGLSTDNRLNHHPEAPPGIDAREWQGRHFNPADPHLYLRIERQCIKGFPLQNAALFSIRTYFIDARQIKQHMLQREMLVAAINSMNQDSLRYKGLLKSKTSIIDWLNT